MNIFEQTFSTTFDVNLLSNIAQIHLIQFLVMELQQGSVFIDNILNSIVVAVTSLNSIWYKLLTVKKKLYALDMTQFVNHSKKSSFCLIEGNFVKILSCIHAYTSTVWVFQDELNPPRVFEHEALPSESSHFFSQIKWTYRNSESILGGEQPFVRQLSSKVRLLIRGLTRYQLFTPIIWHSE